MDPWYCHVYLYNNISVTDLMASEALENLTTTTNLTFNEPIQQDMSADNNGEFNGFIIIMTRIVIPTLCFCGIVGNCFNFLVLASRLWNRIDTVERGASYCILAMGLSDILFCIITLGAALFQKDAVLYDYKNISFYFAMSGNYLQNVLLKTSTGITVITGIYRYMVTLKPHASRSHLTPCFSILASIFSPIFWLCLYIPLLWEWEEHTVSCKEKTLWILKPGYFQTNTMLKKIFENVWAFWGFLVPICILCYCNARIMMSPHFRHKNRQTYSVMDKINTSVDCGSTSQTLTRTPTKQNKKSQKARQCMGVILVSIVVCFVVLVSPSEIIHIYITFKDIEIDERHNIIMYHIFIICNILQVVNMSCNFALYCLVSSQFRKTLKSLFCRNSCVKTHAINEFKMQVRLSRKSVSAGEISMQSLDNV